MPQILDNLTPESTLLPVLQTTLELSDHADFCVGYFNLRGWKNVDSYVEQWPEGNQARVLVGMHRLPHDEFREAFSPLDNRGIDNQAAIRLKQRLAEEFRDQLGTGIPTNNDEAALQRLVSQLLRDMGEVNFSATHQANPRTLAAFEFSEYADDWRDLMRLYMVRRTRSFIQDNYAETDVETGRKYLTYEDGSKSFFPIRVPKTIKFTIDESDPTDRYAKLYSQAVVDVIGALSLPRYGLGKYVADSPAIPPSPTEKQHIQNLSRAGKRLIGFCRINLFKRLESSGWAFLQSVDRHVLRNYVFLHAIRNSLPIPIGTQDAEMLDSRFTDSDADEAQGSMFDPDDDQQEVEVRDSEPTDVGAWTAADFETRAAEVYAEYSGRYKTRFGWLRPDLFSKALEADLQSDIDALLQVLQRYGNWNPAHDAKLNALQELLTETFPDKKILVFSQFADTVRYLEVQLGLKGVEAVTGVTGDSPNPAETAWRFSPVSNEKRDIVKPEQELRIVIKNSFGDRLL